VISASRISARILRGAASSNRRCSSGVRIRVRRLSTLSRPIEALEDLAVPIRTSFVQVCVIAEVDLRELPERYVRLSPFMDCFSALQCWEPAAVLALLNAADR
jgi:hypothetical protein